MILKRLKNWLNPPVYVRPACLSDARRLTKSHVLSWQVTYRGYMPDSALDHIPSARWQARWERYIEAGKDVLVVAKGRLIIGFANFGPSRDHDLDSKRIAELYGIYLHPAIPGHAPGNCFLVYMRHTA